MVGSGFRGSASTFHRLAIQRLMLIFFIKPEVEEAKSPRWIKKLCG
jgi:hypothetical protein